MIDPLVVSVGMTHPRNVAGIGLDIRVAADYRVRHAIVVAAVSAQDDDGVHLIAPLEQSIVEAQLAAAQTRDAAVVRVGAVGSKRNFDAAKRALDGRRVVIDPVLRSSAGGALYVDDPLEALRSFTNDLRAILTPNLDEAAELTALPVRSVDEMIAAGKLLISGGACAALIKGGHLPGEPVDVLVTEKEVETFEAPRIPVRRRGTGCMLAIALACELALGRDLLDAVRGARAYVRANLARA